MSSNLRKLSPSFYSAGLKYLTIPFESCEYSDIRGKLFQSTTILWIFTGCGKIQRFKSNLA